MSRKSKKYLWTIYYIGLVCGALVMNYVINAYGEITVQWMDTFLNLDNIQYVNKHELFLYLLYKRLKQALICSVIYFYISKIAIVLFLIFYGAFILGLTASLFTHYNGVAGVFYGAMIFLPCMVPYGAFLYYILYNFTNSLKKTDKNKLYKAAIFIILIIIWVVFEMVVNLMINVGFFNNK